MTKRETAYNIITSAGGIAKTADFSAHGLSSLDIINLCNDNYIRRIRHGYYQLAENKYISEEYMLSAMLPEGIVCVESALFYYGYSDFTPRKWSIAVPRTFSRTKLNIGELPIKAYYIQDNFINIGKTLGDFNRVKLSVYDRERTVCDCFKYRSRLDNELFNKAVRSYADDPKKNIEKLSMYAKEMKLYKRVLDLMEVLLDG